MSREDALAFEQVAGDVLRSAGYELLEPDAKYPTAAGRRELARFAALSQQLERDRRRVSALAALAALTPRARLS